MSLPSFLSMLLFPISVAWFRSPLLYLDNSQQSPGWFPWLEIFLLPPTLSLQLPNSSK